MIVSLLIGIDEMSDILFVNESDYDGDCLTVEINPTTVPDTYIRI